MNENYIKKLITLVEESKIDSLEVSHWGRKIRITQRGTMTDNGHSASGSVLQHAPTAVSPITPHAAPTPSPQAVEAPAVEQSTLVAITAPMVGTFYTAPAPDADPYVSLNSKVREGQVVCIVEAMKLMNEIEAEVAGRVVEILVENGKPVEFGQQMFLIEPE